MKAERITWKTYHPAPGEFRCHICGERDAEWMAHPQFRGIDTVNLPVCAKCSALPDREAEAIIFDGKIA